MTNDMILLKLTYIYIYNLCSYLDLFFLINMEKKKRKGK